MVGCGELEGAAAGGVLGLWKARAREELRSAQKHISCE